MKPSQSYHKGWVVKGIAPGQKKISRVADPFSSREVANQCKALAEKSGWKNLVVVELSKGEAPPLERWVQA